MKLRTSWLIALAAVIITLALPSLREQDEVLFSPRSYYGSTLGLGGNQEAELPAGQTRDAMSDYRARAAAYVKAQAPNDPDSLLGAGLITEDKLTATDLLRQAAGAGDSPATWSAYAQQLLDTLPEHMSIEECGVDPADPKMVADNQQLLQESRDRGVPEHLRPADVAEVLQALRSWQRADPKNALPVALEADALAATGNMQAALPRWEAAAKLPEGSLRAHVQSVAIAKLLIRVGMPGPEAALAATGYIPMPAYARLRQMSRVALYEGGLARLQGRDAEAIRWWHSTSDLGHTMQQSSDTIIGYLVGVAVEGIGAANDWKWFPADAVGVPRDKAPLLGGLIMYGRYHDWYAKQVGPQEDAQLRDRLVQAKVRSALLHDDNDSLTRLLQQNLAWLLPLSLGLLCAVAAFVHFVLFLAVGSWRRREADEATKLRPPAYVPLALGALVPLAAALVFALLHGDIFGAGAGRTWQVLSAGSGITFGAAIFLPVLIARPCRVTGSSLLTTWRGNLRRLLPVLVAACLLCYLGFAFATARQRQAYVDRWMRSDRNEMTDLQQRFGDRWTHPATPAGAVRTEYPVLREHGPASPPTRMPQGRISRGPLRQPPGP